MPWLSSIGLMSGTSYDGVDVALINTNGEEIGRIGPTLYRPYSDEERATLRAALTDAEAIEARTDRPGCLREAEDLVTRSHAEAVQAFLEENGLTAADVDVVGFHWLAGIHLIRVDVPKD